MAKPLRIQLARGVFHVNACENLGRTLFVDDADRRRFLSILAHVLVRARWELHAYCVMTTHYHILVTTLFPNLGWGMNLLNGIYAQSYNRRYGQETHVFGRRYWSRWVQTVEDYERVVDYIEWNPVRAAMCERPEDWPWSSAARPDLVVPAVAFA